MKKMKRWGVLSLLCLGLSAENAEALVFFEPQAGYSTGAYQSDLVISGVPESYATKINGVSYGARGGLSWSGLQLGADYLSNKLKIVEDEDLDDDSFDTDEIAAFLGYKFYFFRIYGGYIFNAKLKNSDFDTGKGFKAGISFYALRHLAISLETRKVKFDEIEDEVGDTVKADYSAATLLVSFPFEI